MVRIVGCVRNGSGEDGMGAKPTGAPTETHRHRRRLFRARAHTRTHTHSLWHARLGRRREGNEGATSRTASQTREQPSTWAQLANGTGRRAKCTQKGRPPLATGARAAASRRSKHRILHHAAKSTVRQISLSSALRSPAAAAPRKAEGPCRASSLLLLNPFCL